MKVMVSLSRSDLSACSLHTPIASCTCESGCQTPRTVC
jgi:hypothetical protein